MLTKGDLKEIWLELAAFCWLQSLLVVDPHRKKFWRTLAWRLVYGSESTENKN